MPEQQFNPMHFRCAPNETTPEYVPETSFHRFVAYGLLMCWLSRDPEDPNKDCSFSETWTKEHVLGLRDCFLDVLESVIVSLWTKDCQPGDGSIDGDWHGVFIGEGQYLSWQPHLHEDSLLMSLICCDGDLTTLWLDYRTLADRQEVLKVLKEARATLGDRVWPKLALLAGKGEVAKE